MNVDILLHALVAYFVIIDPLGMMLIFHALTDGQDARYGRSMALRAVALSAVVILSFGFFGAQVLSRLGITMEAFRIAGGLLLFHTAFNMVVRSDVSREGGPYKPSNDIVVFPLSIPLMAGPGCLTLTILLFAQAGQEEHGLLSVTLAIGLILALTLVALLLSGKISGIMGETANAVIKRLLGVLLAALAVQFIADGVLGFIRQTG